VYQTSLAKFRGDSSNTVIASSRARCFGVFKFLEGKKSAPVPGEVKTKAQAFFDTL